MTTEEKFNAAVNVIRNLPKNGSYQPSNDMMLRFYSYFKQATEGPCTQNKPAFWEMIKRAKWESWKSLGNMSKELAMNRYIEELKQIVETMSFTDNVAEFMDALGPFYEMAEIQFPGNKAKKDEDATPISEASTPEIISEDVQNDEPEVDLNKREEVIIEREISLPKDNFSDTFYSGSESEGDEFSDPVDNEDSSGDVELTHNGVDTIHVESVEVIKIKELKKNMPELTNGYQKGINDHFVMISDEHVKSKKYDLNGPNKYININNNEKDCSTVRGGGGDSPRSSVRNFGSLDGRHGSSQQRRSGGRSNDTLDDNRTNSRTPKSSGSGRKREPNNPLGQVDDVSEQIAVTLLQLQKDMENVLARLNTLEALTVAQHNMAHGRIASGPLEHHKKSPFWWPFKDISVKTFLFFLIWPAVMQLIMKIIIARWARRRMLRRR